MILPDLNLLLYAHFSSFEQHAAARAWWEEIVRSGTSIALVEPVLFGFVRLATHPRVFEPPMPVSIAIENVRAWLSQPNVSLLVPGPRHLEICLGLLTEIGTAGNLTTDVQIAAYAIENQATLHTSDSDFARFSGLRTFYPLAG